MTAKSEYGLITCSLKMTACLFDVLCDITGTLNTQHMSASFLEINFCFSSTLSRQMTSCFFIPVPSMTSNSHTDLHMYKSHHPNAQGRSKDFFITCKHCGTDTNQGVHTSTNTGWKSPPCPFIKAHGETLWKSV